MCSVSNIGKEWMIWNIGKMRSTSLLMCQSNRFYWKKKIVNTFIVMVYARHSFITLHPLFHASDCTIWQYRMMGYTSFCVSCTFWQFDLLMRKSHASKFTSHFSCIAFEMHSYEQRDVEIVRAGKWNDCRRILGLLCGYVSSYLFMQYTKYKKTHTN